jgi:hypothetical protein
MKKLSVLKAQVTGEIPPPRFGHTFTMVAEDKAVLFGGAVSIAGNEIIMQENLSSLMKPISSTLHL